MTHVVIGSHEQKLSELGLGQLKEVETILTDAQSVGFHSFMYCLNETNETGNALSNAPRSVLSYGFPQLSAGDWSEHQHQQDPIRRLFANGVLNSASTLPFMWENNDGHLDVSDERLSANEYAYLKYCYSCGIRTGINIPFYSRFNRLAIACFYSDLPIKTFRDHEEKIAKLFYDSHRINQHLFRVANIMEHGKATSLSARELECMQWAAKGKNSTEIAQILGISSYTVRDHFKNVAQKLGTTTRVQALSKLMQLGLISP